MRFLIRLDRFVVTVIIASLASVSLASAATDADRTVAQIVEENGKAVLLVSNVGPLGIVQGIGSGFFVRSNGVFVTNYHVVERARAIKVKLADGREVDAAGTIALAPEWDLAILKVNGDKFPTVTLGNSDAVKVGEHVVAMGSPMGLENTVTDGLLSGIRRGEDKPTETKHEKVFQISTPISPGSSGGPVFNMRGEVIGIAYAGIFLIAQNLNFAIPINDAKPLIRDGPVQAIEGSTVTQSLLGCQVMGNQRSFIYHVPGGQFYERMFFSPDAVCFQSEEDAQRHGYRRSLR